MQCLVNPKQRADIKEIIDIRLFDVEFFYYDVVYCLSADHLLFFQARWRASLNLTFTKNVSPDMVKKTKRFISETCIVLLVGSQTL